MLDKLLHYKGTYGDQRNPVPDGLINYEPLIKRMEIYNFEVTEHLHSDLVHIFLIAEGGGLVLSEGKEMSIQAPCALIIPNNTLHGFAYQSDAKGDVFTFSPAFFETSLAPANKIFLQLNQLQQLTFEVASPTFQEIYSIKNNLIHEIKAHHAEKQYAVQLFFQLLMLRLYRTQVQNPTESLPIENKTLAYFNTFQKLIREGVHETKSIQGYAKVIGITPVHLNRVCQTVLKKSALEVVHEFLINEAKKYLSSTSNSISEISYFLGFKDPSHFSKFFKKMEGVSPRAFKKKKAKTE